MLKGKHTCSNNKKTPTIVLKFVFINQHDHATGNWSCKYAQIGGMNSKKKKKTAILLKLCLVLYSEIGLKNCFHLLKEKLQLFSSFWWFYLIGKKKKNRNKTKHIRFSRFILKTRCSKIFHSPRWDIEKKIIWNWKFKAKWFI